MAPSEEHTLVGSPIRSTTRSMENPFPDLTLPISSTANSSNPTKHGEGTLSRIEAVTSSSTAKIIGNNTSLTTVNHLDDRRPPGPTIDSGKLNENCVNRNQHTESDLDGQAADFHYGAFAKSERRLGLRDRTKKAPKRLRQYRQCLKPIEDRIAALEGRIAVQSNTPKPSEPQAVDTISQSEAALPELRLVSIDDYTLGKGQPIPARASAIDVVLDRSYMYQSSYHLQRRNLDISTMNYTTDPELTQKMARGTRDLPERLQINSKSIINILNSLTNRHLDYGESYPLIIQRPFKMLVYCQDSIMEHMKELEAKLGNNEDPVTTSDRFQDFPESEALRLPSPGNAINSSDVAEESAEGAPTSIRYSYTDHAKSSKEQSMWSAEAFKDLRCLVKFMDDYLNPVVKSLRSNLRSDIRFSELWYLFEPGQLVYVKDPNIPQKIWKVAQTTGGRKLLNPRRTLDRMSTISDRQREPREVGYTDFVLDCYYIDFDGSRYGWSYHRFRISRFDNTRPVNSLPIHPFGVAENDGTVKELTLLKQGMEFIKCTECRHLHYSGRSQTRQPSGKCVYYVGDCNVDGSNRAFAENIDSEVMIDFDRALQRNPQWLPDFAELQPIDMDLCEIEETKEYSGDSLCQFIEADWRWDVRRRVDFLEAEAEKPRPLARGFEPCWDDLVLLPDRVFGFILRSRRWACLYLSPDGRGGERLKPIRSSKNGWNDLELPEGHKDIVQSLIERHFTKCEPGPSSFDIVAEKGRGLIVLLHGAPGVGKTSTAECVALLNSRPLLPITCGDLGLTPREVESKLESFFQLAQAWDCVLLLDEADIFLAQRNNSDLERNALVSVFLRVLEYYEGILFLTTNRVGAVDEAIKSRIHMALYYPWLNEDQTRKIWQSQMRRIKDESKIEVELDELGLLNYATRLFATQAGPSGNGPRWNGRQIRNAFHSAVAIAEHGAPNDKPAKLEVSHFQKVVKASEAFDDYLRRTKRGQSDADLASQDMMRTDTYNLQTNQSQSAQPQSFHQYDPSPRLPFRRPPKVQMSVPYAQQNLQPTGFTQQYPVMNAPPTQYQPAAGYQQPQASMQPYNIPQQQPSAFCPYPTSQQWPTNTHQSASTLQPPPQQPPPQQQPGYAIQQAGIQLAQVGGQMQQPQPGAPEQQQMSNYQPTQATQGQQGQNPQLQWQGQGQGQ